MPNVVQMEARLASHLARVNRKMIDKEFDRITRLRAAEKISAETSFVMRMTAPIRIAYILNTQ